MLHCNYKPWASAPYFDWPSGYPHEPVYNKCAPLAPLIVTQGRSIIWPWLDGVTASYMSSLPCWCKSTLPALIYLLFKCVHSCVMLQSDLESQTQISGTTATVKVVYLNRLLNHTDKTMQREIFWEITDVKRVFLNRIYSLTVKCSEEVPEKYASVKVISLIRV